MLIIFIIVKLCRVFILLKSVMYNENLNWFVSEILLVSWLYSFFVVVVEFVRRVFVVLFMNVIGNIRGFLDFVVWLVEIY